MKIIVSFEVWSDEGEVISERYHRGIQLYWGCGKDEASRQISTLSKGIQDLGEKMFAAHTEGKNLKEINVEE